MNVAFHLQKSETSQHTSTGSDSFFNVKVNFKHNLTVPEFDNMSYKHIKPDHILYIHYSIPYCMQSLLY